MIQQSYSWAYTQERKSQFKKIHAPPMFIAALFTIAGTRRQPKHSSTDEWAKKMSCIYTKGHHPATKKERNCAICKDVVGPRDHPTE